MIFFDDFVKIQFFTTKTIKGMFYEELKKNSAFAV